MDLQDSIVGWNRFKCNISMPPIASKFTRLCQRVNGRSKTFLLLDTGNDADLITKLAVGFSNGMDMKSRRLRLKTCLSVDGLTRRARGAHATSESGQLLSES